jgi:hypothetical protein
LDMLAAFLIHSHSLAMPQKLTRKQISEGLDQIPVELLLSAGPNKKPAITSKMKAFARNVAMGKSKAESYRQSYNANPAPATIAREPYKLAADPRVATEIAAYQLAIEAEKHRTPAQLKSLLVQQLVQHSLDEEFPPAQRVQCLKLLGSLFEVGAFVERKEITTVNKSGDIRARLMATLQLVQDVEPKASDDDAAAASLLAELAAPVQEGATADPTGGAGPDADARTPEPLTHTVLHKGTLEKNEGSPEKNIQKFSAKSFRGDASEIGQTTEKFEDME